VHFTGIKFYHGDGILASSGGIFFNTCELFQGKFRIEKVENVEICLWFYSCHKIWLIYV